MMKRPSKANTTIYSLRPFVLALAFFIWIPYGLHAQQKGRNSDKLWSSPGQTNQKLNALAFSNSGKYIATSVNKGDASLWDQMSGNLLAKFGGHGNAITDLSFSKDDKYIATSSWDQTIRIFEVKTLNRLRTFTMHEGAVSSIDFSHDGKYFTTGSWDARVRIFSMPSGRLHLMLPGHLSHVTEVKFSPDDKFVASAGLDGRILLWSVNGKLKGKGILNTTGAPLALAFSKDGLYLASGDDKGWLHVYRVLDGALVRSVPGGFDPTNNLDFQFGGQVVVSSIQGEKVFDWRGFWEKTGQEALVATVPGLTAKVKDKGQFETDFEYFHRVREGSSLLGSLILARDIEEEQRIQARIAASRKAIVLPPDAVEFGTYDVRKSAFPVFLKAEPVVLAIDRENARTLYENKEAVRIEAIEQLGENLVTTQIINAHLIHPITGYKYPLGLQFNIENLPSVATLPAKLTVHEAMFTDTDGDNRLAAGERATLQLTIRNDGEGIAQLVRIIGDTDADIQGLSANLGNIPAGEAETVTLTITGGKNIDEGNAEIKLSTLEMNGFHADPFLVVIPTKAFEAPSLTIADVGIEDAQGRSTITPGVVVSITVRIQNKGEGHADDVKLRVNAGEGVFLAATPNPRQILIDAGAMAPGTFKDLRFQAFANSVVEGFPVTVELLEASGKFGLPMEDLGLELLRPQKSVQELVVSARELNRLGAESSLTPDIAKGIPQAVTTRPDAVAVIIGNRTYQAGTPQVAFALNDAMLMRRYVEQSLGYRPGNILYMEDATLTNFKVTFGDRDRPNGKLKDLVKADVSDVFIFYSGHGAPDPNERKAYLMPIDADPTRLDLTGYSLEVLYDNLSKLKARSITVVIDACFSGASGGGEMLIAQASPIGIRVNDPSALLGENALVITASGGQQVASWYPEMRHGLLTYFFLKGIQGAADYDKSGTITAGEMKVWLHDERDGLVYTARRLHSRDQIPEIWGDTNITIR